MDSKLARQNDDTDPIDEVDAILIAACLQVSGAAWIASKQVGEPESIVAYANSIYIETKKVIWGQKSPEDQD